MPHASVNGVRLFYEERGAGTPIVGIHGAGSSAVFWEDAAQRLSDLGRVITYDRRGSWRSERPDTYVVTNVREHADDALALMRMLEAEPAILVGRSYGGTVALDLALRHPDSVLGIALLEAGPMNVSAAYDTWVTGLLARLEAVDLDAVGEAVVRDVFGAWEDLPELWRDVFTANGPALLAELRGEERTQNERFATLSVPALVVTASASPEPIRDASDALARVLPGARAARVGGDHAIDPAGPDIRAFVSELIAAHSPA